MKANTCETRNTAMVSLGGPVEVYIAEPTKKILNTVMERWFGLTVARIAANGYKVSKKVSELWFSKMEQEKLEYFSKMC